MEEEKLVDGKSGWQSTRKVSKWLSKANLQGNIYPGTSALINITHPNVICLIDSSITKSPVLIFEYAENGNLVTLLKSSASSWRNEASFTVM